MALYLYVLFVIPFGLGIVSLGLSGFSKSGFMLTTTRRIRGRPAMLLGWVFLLLGLLLCWPLILVVGGWALGGFRQLFGR
jgi:hypothetical protein